MTHTGLIPLIVASWSFLLPAEAPPAPARPFATGDQFILIPNPPKE